jgi:hypothetical protein
LIDQVGPEESEYRARPTPERLRGPKLVVEVAGQVEFLVEGVPEGGKAVQLDG